MKFSSRYFSFFLTLVLVLSAGQGIAQSRKVAILTPLFLDSAFDAAGTYRYDKTFPRFINPGLEFYEGAQLAIDSMAKEGDSLEVFVIDTRGSQSLNQILETLANRNVELIIAHNTAAEMRTIASFAHSNAIPYINVNLPNDAGVNNNPYMVLLNPTLRTHIEGIYRYAQKYHALDDIIMFRRNGAQENMIKKIFEDFGKVTASVPLNIRYVDIGDDFDATDIAQHLDSNKHSVCIAGSLQSRFGRLLAQQLATLTPSYPITTLGMPTWDGFNDLDEPEYKGLEIVYSTPFYNSRTDSLSLKITEYFNTEMYARPSDMVFRGYETTWRFVNMLQKYGADLSSNLSRQEFDVFRKFDIQPVFLNRETMTLDYFENKQLYFVKMMNGLVIDVKN